MNHLLLSDQELVAKILENDQDAISCFLKIRCKNVLTYIKSNLFRDNYIEIDDLISELYLYLKEDNWKKLREFEYRSKLTTWISVVAFRYFRKKYSELVTDNRLFCPIDVGRDYIKIDNFDENWQAKIDLLDAINRIKNPTYKLVLLRMEIEGYEPGEMAKKLNTTVSNVYNIKSRARKELQTIFSEVRRYE